MAPNNEPGQLTKMMELEGYQNYAIDLSPLEYYFMVRYGMAEAGILSGMNFLGKVKRRRVNEYLSSLIAEKKKEFEARNNLEITYDSVQGRIVERKKNNEP